MNGDDKPVAEGNDEDDGSEEDDEKDRQDVEAKNLCRRLLLLKCFHSAQKNESRLQKLSEIILLVGGYCKK